MLKDRKSKSVISRAMPSDALSLSYCSRIHSSLSLVFESPARKALLVPVLLLDISSESQLIKENSKNKQSWAT